MVPTLYKIRKFSISNIQAFHPIAEENIPIRLRRFFICIGYTAEQNSSAYANIIVNKYGKTRFLSKIFAGEIM